MAAKLEDQFQIHAVGVFSGTSVKAKDNCVKLLCRLKSKVIDQSRCIFIFNVVCVFSIANFRIKLSTFI